MAKSKLRSEVFYVEQDLCAAINEDKSVIVADYLANRFATGNNSGLAEFLEKTNLDLPTLSLLLDYVVADRLSAKTQEGGIAKYRNSDFPKLKEQLLFLFHQKAHLIDETTGKPLYKTKARFIDAVLPLLQENATKGEGPEAGTVARWLEEVRAEFPSHWPQYKQ